MASSRWTTTLRSEILTFLVWALAIKLMLLAFAMAAYPGTEDAAESSYEPPRHSCYAHVDNWWERCTWYEQGQDI